MSEDRSRDRSATEARVLKAAEQMLIDGQAGALGVNALAKAAGCDKQLIYRYFDGPEGVLARLGEQVAERLKAALGAAEAKPASWRDFTLGLAKVLIAAYRADPVLGRLRAAELSSPPGTLARFVEVRGAVMNEFVTSHRPHVPPPAGVDVPALHALLTGAIEASVLSAAATGRMTGLALVSDADWQRLETALLTLIDKAYG